MRKNLTKKASLILVCLLVISLAVTACGSAPGASNTPATSNTPAAPNESATSVAAPASTQHEPFEVNIYSYTTGTFMYTMSMAWADLINKYSDWLTATAVESPGSIANEQMMYNDPSKRDNTFFFAMGDAAARGVDQFEGKQNTNAKMVVNFGLTLNGAVTCDPDVKTLDDLSNKVVAVWPNGSNTPFATEVLNRANPSIKVEGIDTNQALESVLSGKIGAALIAANAASPDLDVWAPNPAAQEFLSRATPLHFVDIPADLSNSLVNEQGGRFEDFNMVGGVIPAMALDDRQTEPWQTFINNSAYMAYLDMDDEVVAEALGILLEHYPELVDYHRNAEMLSLEVMSLYSGYKVEFHPAALKAFNDRGVTPINMQEYMARQSK